MNPNAFQPSFSMHNIIHYPIAPLTNSAMYNMPHINFNPQIRFPNFKQQLYPDQMAQNIYGFGNSREVGNGGYEKSYFNSKSHQNFNAPQDVKVPALDSPDPYVHYLFLESIKVSHKYLEKSEKPPFFIVSYLFGLLSLENCPYPFSVLEYIAINIPHFLLHFAPHEIHFLGEILDRRYPVWVDYEQEYHKIHLMDRSQSKKLLSLVLTLAVLHGQLSKYKSPKPNMAQKNTMHVGKHTEDSSQNQIEWIVNYMLVSTAHLSNLKSVGQDQLTQELRIQMEEGINSLRVSREELVALLKANEEGSLGGRLKDKIAKLIYQILPKGELMKREETEMALEIVFQWQKIGGFRLFREIESKLTEEIGRIGKRISKDEHSLKIRTQYMNFCFKTLNILSLRQFQKHEDLKLINFISACKLLCGCTVSNRNGNQEKEEFENEYYQTIELAFHIAKQKKILKCVTKQVYEEVLRNDEW